MTIEKLDQRIEELKQENAADQEKLIVLETKYEEAVNAFQADKTDKLHTEIVGIKNALDSRIKQIAILTSPDNPIRKEAKAAHFTTLEQERNAVQAKADALKANVLKAQAAYIELANEVFAVNAEYRQAERKYSNAIGKEYYPNAYLDLGTFTINIGSSRQDIDPRNAKRFYKGGK